ncbi:MAG: DNA alkylation repair protein [Anaerolineae bacterium]|nr:DNA alkylation repair protein [Anaerolineae bacterium]
MDYETIMAQLESMGDPEVVAGLARVGSTPGKLYGVKIPKVRALAKDIRQAYRKDKAARHALAAQLWDSGVHEARILASIIDDPAQVAEEQIERWAADFDSWDVCDQCCMNLFEKTPFAYAKAVEWSTREEEYVKRAGFVMMARLAVSDKRAGDDAFTPFLPVIVREATDERNMVKKAVNWALRQIGKRNLALNAAAIATAGQIQALDSKAARWVASDALRELTDAKIQARLR